MISVADKLTKKCKYCGKTKAISKFVKNSNQPDGIDTICSDCRKKMAVDEEGLILYCKESERGFNKSLFQEALIFTEKKLKKQYNGEDYHAQLIPKSINYYFSKMNLPQNETTLVKKPVNLKRVVDEGLIDKWGYGYDSGLYTLFENKYQKLSNTYQLPTESHKEFLMKACVCSVKADEAMANGNVKDAKEWMAMFKDVTSAGKLQPSQMSKADLSQGMDTFGQLARMVEEAIDIIPILPQFKKQPKDLPDFNIWCWINYVRDLQGLPLCTYEEVYKFYEDRKNDYLNSGFIEEEI